VEYTIDYLMEKQGFLMFSLVEVCAFPHLQLRETWGTRHTALN
jgi:hypothetical protein